MCLSWGLYRICAVIEIQHEIGRFFSLVCDFCLFFRIALILLRSDPDNLSYQLPCVCLLVVQQPNSVLSHLNFEFSRSQTYYTLCHFSRRVIVPSQRKKPNNQKRQKTICSVNFEPAIPASERLLTHVLDSAINGIAQWPCIFLYHGATVPSGPGPPHCRRFMITLRHTTLCRTPLDE